MPLLGEQVGQAAQQTVEQQGHTVGDAFQAYHIAATAEHARQELDMEKQKQDMAKATWATSQLDAISRMPEATRKLAAASFVRQAKQIYPDMSDDIGSAIEKDSDFTKGLARTFAAQHGQDPTVISNAFGGDLPALQSHITKTMEEESKIKAAQLGMAQSRMQMLEETKRQHGLAFSEKATTDKIINLSRQNINSLVRSEGILNNPKLPVTATDLKLAYQDFSNAVAQGGAATEGQIQRDIPESTALELNNLIRKYAGTNIDLRKTSAGQNLIGLLGGRITAVKGDINNAVANQAQIYHDMGVNSGNPYVTEAAKGILQQYAPQVYAQKYGASGMAAAAPAASPTPAVAPPAAPATSSTALTTYGSVPKEIEQNYQMFKAQQAHKKAQQAGGN